MSWQLHESNLPQDPDVLGTLFCVGNGNVCTRGTLSEQGLGTFRGTYVAGLYTFAGYGLNYLMGAPDWLPAFVSQDGVTPLPVSASARTLDMRTGVLTRTAEIRVADSVFEIVEERFASLVRTELLCQRLSVRRLEGSAPVRIVIGIDGDIRNHRAKYYRVGEFPNVDAYGVKLSRVEDIRADADGLFVRVLAESSQLHCAVAARVVQASGDSLKCRYRVQGGLAAAVFDLPAGANAAAFEKFCCLAADVDGSHGKDLTPAAAGKTLKKLSFAKALAESAKAWARYWSVADVRIQGDTAAEQAVRYALFSTRIASPQNNGAGSLGAKNISGDWYRGGVFWDMEIFQLPMLAATSPELVRNHIRYRYRRLGAARRLARQDGYRGGQFPFTSYQTGLEEPQSLHSSAGTHQYHVNLAVAWGVLHYLTLTGDEAFVLRHGLEILLETNLFWATRTEKDASGQYHLKSLRGPDELHYRINDNAYTNRFIGWVLGQTDELIARLAKGHSAAVKATLARCGVTREDRALWRDMSRNMYIPMLPDGQVMSQFEGFGAYPEPDEKLTHEKGEGKDKTHKQADTLLLFQVLPFEFSEGELEEHYQAYAPLCHQTSSLSLCTHALLAARLGLSRDAWRYFCSTRGVDLADSLGNTAHGIHGAGQGGVWLAAIHGFGGLTVGVNRVAIRPALPPQWERLDYRFLCGGQLIEVSVSADSLTVTNRGKGKATIELASKPVVLAAGATRKLRISQGWCKPRLEAVIFDLDGVLVSTDRFHYQAWKELADSQGLAFDEKVNHRLRGVSREDSLKTIFEHNSRPLPGEDVFSQMCAAKNARYVELVSAMTPDDVLPGAKELLVALRSENIHVGIASASRNTRLVLDRTGLTQLVDAVSDGNTIAKGKPDPQVFYNCAQRLRVLPWNCVGVEDAETGIQSIHGAGMVAVSVGPAAPGGEVTVGSVAELSVASLLKVFADYENPTDPYHARNVAKMLAELAK